MGRKGIAYANWSAKNGYIKKDTVIKMRYTKKKHKKVLKVKKTVCCQLMVCM